MRIGAWDSDSGDVYVIAEAGINHHGDEGAAHALVRAAVDAGANAVKFQWFNVDALKARRGPQAESLRPYVLSADAMGALQAECEHQGITFLCSVFDLESADAYLALDPPAVKIGSGELGEHHLIKRAASYGKPMILSTGMAEMYQIQAALQAIVQPGLAKWSRLALLHCVSAYPTPLDQVNLRALDALKAFHCPVGFSDHTLGYIATTHAVARGACIIEKHLTLDPTLPGPDHRASMTPEMFARMVAEIRQVTAMLGHGRKEPMPCEAETMRACGR